MPYHCQKCQYTTYLKGNFKTHLMSKKHNTSNDILFNIQMDRKKICSYHCTCCNIYLTSRSERKKHFRTMKHKTLSKGEKCIIVNKLKEI